MYVERFLKFILFVSCLLHKPVDSDIEVGEFIGIIPTRPPSTTPTPMKCLPVSEMDDMEKKLYSALNELAQVRTENDKLQALVKVLQENVTNNEKEKSDLHNQIDQMNLKHKTCVDKSEEELKRYNVNIDEQKHLVEQTINSTKKLQIDYESCQTSKIATDGNLKALQEKLTIAEKDFNNCERKTTNLTSEFEKNLKLAREKQKLNEENLKSVTDTYHNKLETCNNNVQNLTKENENLKGLTTLIHQVTKLKDELKTCETKRHYWEQQKCLNVTEMDKIEQKLFELTQIKAELNNLQMFEKEAQDIIANCESKISNMQNQNDNLHVKIKQLVNESEIYAKQVNEFSLKYEELRSTFDQAAKCSNSNKLLQDELQSCIHSKNKSNEHIRTLEGMLTNAVENQIQCETQKSKLLVDCENKIVQTKQGCNSNEQNLKTVTDILQNKLNTCEFSVQSLTVENRNLKGLSVLAGRVAKIESDLITCETKQQCWNQQYASIQEALQQPHHREPRPHRHHHQRVRRHGHKGHRRHQCPQLQQC